MAKYSAKHLDAVLRGFEGERTVEWVLVGPKDQQAIASIDSNTGSASVLIIETDEEFYAMIDHLRKRGSRQLRDLSSKDVIVEK